MSQSTPHNGVFAPALILSASLLLHKRSQEVRKTESRTDFTDFPTCIMEKLTIPHDLKVFGVHVNTFPNGISDAFDALIKRIPNGEKRSYYGISDMSEDGRILYYAAAEEKFEGEGKKYNCDIYIVKKGEYLTVTLNNWRKKTDSIKDVFEAMMSDERIDKTNPCIEWYKNNDEMLCMVKLNKR